MQNITYMTKYYNLSFQELMDSPYAVFLSYLKWARLYQLQETEEGRDALYKQGAIHQTEPELGRIRSLAGYKSKNGSEE